MPGSLAIPENFPEQANDKGLKVCFEHCRVSEGASLRAFDGDGGILMATKYTGVRSSLAQEFR